MPQSITDPTDDPTSAPQTSTEILDRDIAVAGSPDAGGEEAASNDGVSSSAPAEGDDDVPPPGEGSPGDDKR